MVRRLAALVLSAGLLPAPHVLFRLSDPRLTELSGIAVGIRSPGVFYAQNDSGDSARFFALDRGTGRVVAEIRVTGAVNVDWEDIAVAPDWRGVPSVWIADIGDNRGTRGEVRLYRVDEPRVTVGGPRVVVTRRADVWRLRYPSGHPDAESIAVSPDGRAYLVTKNLIGASTVYRVPVGPAAGVQRLVGIGTVRFGLTGTGGGPLAAVGNLLATGAALSRDGRTLAIRTYTDAWFWRVPSGGVVAALRSRSVHIPLPPQPQGEGIAFAGDRVVVDSERVGSRVCSVPVPALSSSFPSASGGTSGRAAAPSQPSRRAAARSTSGLAASVVGVVFAVSVGALAWRVIRRSRT